MDEEKTDQPTDRLTYPADLAMNHAANGRPTDHPAQEVSAVSWSDQPNDQPTDLSSNRLIDRQTDLPTKDLQYRLGSSREVNFPHWVGWIEYFMLIS